MSTKAHQRTARKTRSNIRPEGQHAPKRRGHRPNGVAPFGGFGLPPLAVQPLMAFDVESKLTNTNLPKEIYNGIRKPASEFLKQFGKKLVVPRSIGNYAEKVKIVCNQVREQLEKQNKEVRLSLLKGTNDKYYLEAHCYLKVGEQTIYTLPLFTLEVLDKINSPLLPYMMHLYAQLMSCPGFTDWNNDSRYNYVATEMLMHEANERADEGEEESAKIILKDCFPYAHRNGKAVIWLDRIRQLRESDLSEIDINHLREMKVHKRFQFFKQWILSGFELLKQKDRQFLYELQNDHEFDEDYSTDGDSVSLESQYVVCYDTNDLVMDSYCESVSMDSQEFGSFSPMFVYKVGKSPYQFNTWFERFIEWFTPGTIALCAFNDKNRRKYGEKLNR